MTIRRIIITLAVFLPGISALAEGALDPASPSPAAGPVLPPAASRFSEFLNRQVDNKEMRQELEKNRRQEPTRITAVASASGDVAAACQRPLPAALEPEERQSLARRECLVVLAEWLLSNGAGLSEPRLRLRYRDQLIPRLAPLLAASLYQADAGGLGLFLWRSEEVDGRILVCLQSNDRAVQALISKALREPTIAHPLYPEAVAIARAGNPELAFGLLADIAEACRPTPRDRAFFIAAYQCYLAMGPERKTDAAKIGGKLRDDYAATMPPALRQALEAEAEAAGLPEEAAAWRRLKKTME